MLKRLGLWKEQLLRVNVASQGGPSPGGTPLIPILTPGSSSQLCDVTAEEEEDARLEAEYLERLNAAAEEERKSRKRERTKLVR